MLNRKNYRNFKFAGVTVEISLAMVLCLTILFVAIGIWGDNLGIMVQSSGIHNIFNKDNSAAKAANWGTTQSKTLVVNDPTPSQENTQIMGEQGLSDYLANAQATINKYLATPPTTEAQIEDLAKAATIKKVNDVSSLTQQERNLVIQSNISIDVNNGKTTINNSKTINYARANAINTDADVLAAMKVIYNS